MLAADSHEEFLDNLLIILEGLVSLHIARLSDPDEYARALARREELADALAAADRLAAPGNFVEPADRRLRGHVLNAAATCLALGAYQDGGITWNGLHWCVRDHPGCPYRPDSKPFGGEV